MVLLAVPAGAQDGDPYGSTTTTAPTQVSATCELSSSSGSAGAQVTATVGGVPVGETVRMLFDGTEVGRGTADAGDGSSATTSVQIAFQVPEVESGTHTIAAVGASFTAECSASFGAGGASVLGFTVERGRAAGGSSTASGGGRLARTGVAIVLLVAVALALVVIGRTLLEPGRRIDAPGAAPRSRRE